MTPQRAPDEPPSLWPGRLRRLGRGLLAGSALLGIVAAALLVLGRGWAESEVARRLKAEASQRGVAVSWEGLTLDYDLTLQIQGIKSEGPSGLTVELKRLEADWTLEDLFEGRKLPRSVRTEGLNVSLNLEASGGGTGGASGRAAVSSGASRSVAALQEKLSELLEVTVQVQGGTARVRGLPGVLGPVTLESISFFAGPAQGGAWSGALIAQCAQGCGDPQPLRVNFTRDDVGLKALTTLETPRTFVFEDARLESPLKVNIGGGEVRLPYEGTPNLAVREIFAAFDHDGYRGTLRVERVRVHGGLNLEALPDFVELRRPTLTLERPHNPNPRQEPVNASEQRWLKRVHRKGDAHPLLARLPELNRALALKDKALPHLRRVVVEHGEVRLAGEALHLERINVRHEGERTRVAFAEGSGEVAVWMTPESRDFEVELSQIPIDRARALLNKPTWDVRGAFSGALTVRLGGEALDGAPELTHTEALDATGGLHIRGELTLQGGYVNIKPLSSTPIEDQRARLSLHASYIPPSEPGGDDHVALRRLQVQLPSRIGEEAWVSMRLEATLTHLFDGGSPEVDLRLWMPETGCEQAFGAIPAGMIPNLHDQIRAQGAFAPSLTFTANMANVYGLEMDLTGLPGTCKVLTLGKLSPAWLNTDFKLEVREGVSRSGIMVGPGTSGYVKLNSIPAHTRAITFLTEEGGFYNSPGFSLSLIKRAVRLNLDRQRYAYGGSTISQQLVKNLFMTREKTLSRKLEEAFIVWRMEELLDKNRILELYLNCIEYGPDLYGIRRAARFYFGKSPAGLSPLEGAFLASIKPSPLVGPNFMGAGHTPVSGWWQARMQSLVSGMYRRGLISQRQYEDAKPFIVFFRTFGGDRRAFREKIKAQQAAAAP